MPATDRLSLLLESKTIGLEDVLRMEKALNRVLEQGQKARATGDGVAAATRNVSASTQQFGQNIGQFIRDPLGTAATAAEGFITKLGPMGIGMAAVGTAAVASGAALISWIKSTGDAAERILNLSITTGLSAKEVQLFQGALELSGASIESLERGAIALNQQLSDVGPTGQKARQSLASIGVSIYDANGALKEAGPLLLDLSKGLASVGDRAERDRIGVDLLGKQYRALIPAFSELGANVETLRRDGYGIDGKTLQQADELADKLTRIGNLLGQNVTLAKAFLGTFLGPVFDSILAPPPSTPWRGPTTSTAGPRIGDGFIESVFGVAGGTRSPTAASSRLLASLSGTSIESERQQLSDLRTQIDSQRLKVRQLADNPDITEAAATREIAALRGLESQYRKLEAAIKASEDAKREFDKLNALGTFTVTDQFFRFGAQRTPSLRRGAERQFPLETNPFGLRLADRDGAAIQITEASIQAANAGSEAAAAARAKAILEGTRLADEQAKRLRVESIQQSLAFESERLRLIAGPGGELAAVKAIAQLRLDSVQAELAITGDLRAAEEARLRIFRDRALEELRISKERDDRNRQTGGQVFDALVAGGAGIRGFASGFGIGQGRTAFGNLFSEIARGTTGALQLPGQVGADGRPNLFGRVLSGTAFGLDPNKIAIDANTLATQLNTAAQQQNTAAQLGGRVGGAIGGSLGSIFGAPSSVFGGAGTNPLIFSATGGTRSSGITGADGLPLGIVGQGLGLGNPNLGLTTLQKVGAAAGIAGGGFLVKSGIQQGGLGGALDIGAGGAGALAALLPLIGVSGPAAPILAGVALGAQVIKNFLPDPRKARAAAIDRLVNASRVDFGDVTGIDTDFARGGSLASTKGGIVVIQNINAADAKSFLDRRDDIAAAISQSIEEGNSRLREGITRTVDLGPV